MATRGLVDACIDDFWRSAKARPVSEDALNYCASKAGSKSARGASLGLHSARRAEPDPERDQFAEFRNASVEVHGREGFNSIAVNGIWRFWRVRNGRLAFRRDVDVEVERDAQEEEGDSADVAPPGIACPTTITIRLFLYYSPQADAWLISDAPDTSGSITADCGPVNDGEDLAQLWRVWDGETWREDRNVRAEVSLGGSGFANLKGLQVTQHSSRGQPRAHSQEPRSNALPELLEPRAPDASKPLVSARRR